MMAHTSRDLRFFLRLLSSEAVLWSEMIPASEVLRSDDPERRWGRTSGREVAQLGGADPEVLREAADVLRDMGYVDLNLNVGCPSARVAGQGKFGAALMRDPDLVAACCEAMGPDTSVKHRLGVVSSSNYSRERQKRDDDTRCSWNDDDDVDGGLDEVRASAFRFVRTVSASASRFVVHARVGILDDDDDDSNNDDSNNDDSNNDDSNNDDSNNDDSNNDDSSADSSAVPSVRRRFSRRERYEVERARRATTMANRHVPPLRHGIARELKREFPECEFVSNGGIDSIDSAERHAADLDGAMVGRALVSHPCAFADIDRRWYGKKKDETGALTTRGDVLDAYVAYVEDACSRRSALTDQDLLRLIAPAYHLFNGEPRNGAYMRRLKFMAHHKVTTRLVSPATALRAAKAEVPKGTLYDKPLTDFTPLTDLPAYDREVRRAGPLARLVH